MVVWSGRLYTAWVNKNWLVLGEVSLFCQKVLLKVKCVAVWIQRCNYWVTTLENNSDNSYYCWFSAARHSMRCWMNIVDLLLTQHRETLLIFDEKCELDILPMRCLICTIHVPLFGPLHVFITSNVIGSIVSPLFIEHAEFVSGLGDWWKCRLLWIVEVRVCMVLTSSWGVWASKLFMVTDVLEPVARHFILIYGQGERWVCMPLVKVCEHQEHT